MKRSCAGRGVVDSGVWWGGVGVVGQEHSRQSHKTLHGLHGRSELSRKESSVPEPAWRWEKPHPG